jgi:hypothetical protein
VSTRRQLGFKIVSLLSSTANISPAARHCFSAHTAFELYFLIAAVTLRSGALSSKQFR